MVWKEQWFSCHQIVKHTVEIFSQTFKIHQDRRDLMDFNCLEKVILKMNT